MTAPHTPDSLAALLEQATPGPWQGSASGNWVVALRIPAVGARDLFRVVDATDADAALIVALRNDAARFVAADRLARQLVEHMTRYAIVGTSSKFSEALMAYLEATS